MNYKNLQFYQLLETGLFTDALTFGQTDRFATWLVKEFGVPTDD